MSEELHWNIGAMHTSLVIHIYNSVCEIYITCISVNAMEWIWILLRLYKSMCSILVNIQLHVLFNISNVIWVLLANVTICCYNLFMYVCCYFLFWHKGNNLTISKLLVYSVFYIELLQWKTSAWEFPWMAHSKS